MMTRLRTLLMATAALLIGPIMLTSACGGDDPATSTVVSAALHGDVVRVGQVLEGLADAHPALFAARSDVLEGDYAKTDATTSGIAGLSVRFGFKWILPLGRWSFLM